MQAVSHATHQEGGLANIARCNFDPCQNTGFVPEDLNQIQTNLSFGARPVTQADRNRMRQANYQSQQNQAGMMAMAHAHQEQTRVMQQQMNQMRRAQYLEAQKTRQQQQQIENSESLKLLNVQAQQKKEFKATVQKEGLSQKDVAQKVFKDPRDGKNILEQLHGEHRVAEDKMKQAQLNLENLNRQQSLNADEKKAIEMMIKSEFAQNWLRHDVKNNGDGTTMYRGVTMPEDVAGYTTYADAKQYWDKEKHLSQRDLQQAASDFTEALKTGSKFAFDLWIGDDLKTLNDPSANTFTRGLAGAALLSNFVPAGLPFKGIKAIHKTKGLAKVLKSKGFEFSGQFKDKSDETIQYLRKELKLKPEHVKKFKDLFRQNKRYIKTDIYKRNDGSILLRSEVQSYQSDSYTVYEKLMDSNGKTKLMGHSTYYKDGTFIHWKKKSPQLRIGEPQKQGEWGYLLDLIETN